MLARCLSCQGGASTCCVLKPGLAACIAVLLRWLLDQVNLACAGASQLEKVELGWCSSVTDADIKALARLPLLREIDLSRTLVRSLMSFGVSQHLRGQCMML